MNCLSCSFQEEVNEIAEVMVRALDNLLDYQDYPVDKALKAKDRRALGVGITNYAAWLASNFASYADANDITHEMMERIQYALIKASVKLASEKGPCTLYKETRYGRGELPIDWYNERIDQLAAPNYVCDFGGKTLYYHNTRDGSGNDDMIQDSADCAACKL